MIRPRIVRDREIMHGLPCIANTRVPSAMVRSFDYDVELIRDEYPHLTYAQINAAIDHDRHWSRRLRRWLEARTRGLRYRVAAWLIGMDAETLQGDVG